MNVETIGCCHFWNYWSIQFKSKSKPWQIAFIQRKPTRWSKQSCKIIEDVPADKPLIWCPRAFLHQNPRTNIDTIEPQLWTRTHHLDVNRRPLEWASQPPVLNSANTCPFWNYWSTQIANDILTKGMNYDELLQNYRKFCKDARNTILQSPWTNYRLMTVIFACCHASLLSVQPIKNKTKLLPWTWIMLQTHFHHYRRKIWQDNMVTYPVIT